MSNWITDEANEHNDRVQKKEHEKRLIQQSDYWSLLVRQVEADVNKINEHPYWKPRLVDFPLQCSQNSNGGYQVSKSSNPAVVVGFTNLGDHIEVKRISGTGMWASGMATSEDLFIGVMGENVVLHSEGKQTFIVPADASRYILKAIMQALKEDEG